MAGDILFLAEPQRDKRKVLANQSASRVSVTLALNATNGAKPADDDSAGNYFRTVILSEGILGQAIAVGKTYNQCAIGTELVGTVSPSNYQGKVWIARTQSGNTYGQTKTGTLSGADTQSNLNYIVNVPTSPAGHVYELDLPGTSALPNGTQQSPPQRYRVNFTAYAVLDDPAKGKQVSDNFNYYAAASCGYDANLNTVFASDVTADNRAAPGTIKTTWNMQ